MFNNFSSRVAVSLSLVALTVASVEADTIAGGSVVTGNLDVGATATPGKLKVVGQTGASAIPSLEVSGDGGVVFKGTYGTGQIPATGAGARMMWYPKKMAFRAGYASGSEWDDAQIGVGSIVLGFTTEAGGEGSVAIGPYNSASGAFSSVLGSHSEATGAGAIAVGENNYASGANSISLGTSTYTGGIYSIATGLYTTSQGYGQFVIGARNIPQGSTSTWVPSDDLFIIGNGDIALGESNAMTVKKNGVVNVFTRFATTPAIVFDPTGTPSITVGGQKVVTSDSLGNIGVRAPATTSGITIGSASGSNEIVFTNMGPDAAEIMHLGNANLVLGTNNTARMTVTGGGTVGIGITSPNTSYQLDVANYSSLGGLRINGNDEANTFLNTNGKQISINASAGNGITVKTTGAVVVGEWNAAAQQKFNVMGKSYFSDSVGIGTTTPGSKLDIISGGTGVSFLTNEAGLFGGIAFNREAATGAIFNSSSYAYQWNNANSRLQLEIYNGAGSQITTNALTVSSAANVGIGTSAPTAKLEVAGSLKTTGTVQFAKQGDIPMGEFGLNGD